MDFVPQLELLELAALTITHGAGIAQLRYGDDGDPDRLRPARRGRSGGLIRQRRGRVPPSIGCGPIPLAGRTPSHQLAKAVVRSTPHDHPDERRAVQ